MENERDTWGMEERTPSVSLHVSLHLLPDLRFLLAHGIIKTREAASVSYSHPSLSNRHSIKQNLHLIPHL